VRNEAQKPGVVVHICNPSTWVTEAGGSRVPDQLHSETPLRPPKKKEKKKKNQNSVEGNTICVKQGEIRLFASTGERISGHGV
jgi:hypothetical protein